MNQPITCVSLVGFVVAQQLMAAALPMDGSVRTQIMLQVFAYNLAFVCLLLAFRSFLLRLTQTGKPKRGADVRQFVLPGSGLPDFRNEAVEQTAKIANSGRWETVS
jgi:hypothetical protein